MKKLFFYKLYLFDKRLFFCLVVCCGLTILCNISGIEVTPFFVWAMYSEKESNSNEYEIYEVKINDNKLVQYTDYTDNNRFFLISTLDYYKRIQKNNSTDPTPGFLKQKSGSGYNVIRPVVKKLTNSINEQQEFPAWYKRYLEQSTGNKIQNYTVRVLTAHFTKEYNLQTDSSYLLAAWNQH
jgi:hypothetical protein